MSGDIYIYISLFSFLFSSPSLKHSYFILILAIAYFKLYKKNILYILASIPYFLYYLILALNLTKILVLNYTVEKGYTLLLVNKNKNKKKTFNLLKNKLTLNHNNRNAT